MDKIEKRLLTLYERGDKRKASNQAVGYIEEGMIFSNKELLKQIVEPFGYTIAHKLALEGALFEDEEILKLTGEDRFGDTGRGKDIRGHGGSSVAFIIAKRGHFIKNKAVWKLGSEKKKRSVAHEMAKNGYSFQDKEILKLKDDINLSVAHEMARKGHKFEDEEILEMKSLHGFSVKDFQE